MGQCDGAEEPIEGGKYVPVFVEPNQINDKRVVITGSDVNHIRNVLRMKPGEEIAVSNGTDGREYRCGIVEIGEEQVICELRFIKEDGLELSSRVHLFQGLPKADKMELIIQKAVELGVYEVIPVETKRAVVKLDAKRQDRKRSAGRQSQRLRQSRASGGSSPGSRNLSPLHGHWSWQAAWK